MTIPDFQNMRFGAGMVVIYKEHLYDIYAVDFEENLIQIGAAFSEDGFWVRCENCEIKKPFIQNEKV